MEPLVNYRLLAGQLTQTEFAFFLQETVTKLNARDMFTKLLYDKFKKSPNIVRSFTNIITNIIRNRENIEASPRPNTISQLPSPIISECGSYLEMNEYFKVGQSCRKLYVALQKNPNIIRCNISPSSIITQCPRSYSFQIFPNCQNLNIDTKYFESLSFQNQSV